MLEPRVLRGKKGVCFRVYGDFLVLFYLICAIARNVKFYGTTNRRFGRALGRMYIILSPIKGLER